jgi:GNAT superfamily N-acetyltransferase
MDGEVAQPLVAELDAELARRYDDDAAIDASPAEFTPPTGRFVVALADGRPVACGGFRRLTPTVAELKRMYVRPPERGRGLGRRLLADLEHAAREAGYAELWLETGTAQPEAMALYASAGYRLIPNFGQFADSPMSRCYAKSLSPIPSNRAPLS